MTMKNIGKIENLIAKVFSGNASKDDISVVEKWKSESEKKQSIIQSI